MSSAAGRHTAPAPDVHAGSADADDASGSRGHYPHVVIAVTESARLRGEVQGETPRRLGPRGQAIDQGREGAQVVRFGDKEITSGAMRRIAVGEQYVGRTMTVVAALVRGFALKRRVVSRPSRVGIARSIRITRGRRASARRTRDALSGILYRPHARGADAP
jgi:hypothetical protein